MKYTIEETAIPQVANPEKLGSYFLWWWKTVCATTNVNTLGNRKMKPEMYWKDMFLRDFKTYHDWKKYIIASAIDFINQPSVKIDTVLSSYYIIKSNNVFIWTSPHKGDTIPELEFHLQW